MNADAMPDSEVLRNLRRSSEANGMKFYLHPAADVLPSFLQGFQPDALIVGLRGGWVLEFKQPGAPEPSGERAAELARRISGQPGWVFRAIDLGPASDHPAPIAIPTADQIEAALSEISILSKQGHDRAAVLAGWAVLEALARLANDAAGVGTPAELTPIQAVQALAALGYLEEPDAEYLRQLSRLRNAIAHGDLAASPAQAALDRLVGQLRTIAVELHTAAPAPA